MDSRPVRADPKPRAAPAGRGGVAGRECAVSKVPALFAAGDGDREGCAARGSTRPAEVPPPVTCVCTNASARLAFDSACLGEGGADVAARPSSFAYDLERSRGAALRRCVQ